jgi:hypothetical protein
LFGWFHAALFYTTLLVKGSQEQDDLRSASEALRRTLRYKISKYSECNGLSPRRYSDWERGSLDLDDDELVAVRLGMLALAQAQKITADKCLNFARRHQQVLYLRQEAIGEA